MARPFESRIQDLVYNVEVGVGLRIIKGLLYVFFVTSIMVMYAANEFQGFRDAQAMEYAQLGRNLAQPAMTTVVVDGEEQRQALPYKFYTKCVRPFDLWYQIEHSGNPMIVGHPDVRHAPMYPAALAAVFKVSNPEFQHDPRIQQKFGPERVVMVFGLLCTLVAGLFTWLLARRLFDGRVGLMAMTLFFLSDTVWGHAVSGLPVTFAMTGTIIAFYFATMAVMNSREGKAGWTIILPVILSCVMALMVFLTRYAAFAVTPALMLFYIFGMARRGWIPAVLLLLAVVGGAAPWFMRNKEVCGAYFGLAPYEALRGTLSFPNDELDRTLNPEDRFKDRERLVKGVRSAFMGRLGLGYKEVLSNLGEGFLPFFFFATFFYAFVRPQVNILRWAMAFMLVILWLVASAFGETVWRLFTLVWPVAIIYGAAFFYILLDRQNFEVKLLNVLVTSAMILVCALPLVFTLLPPRKEAPYPPYQHQLIGYVSNMLDPNELMCTDMPWATAWYGNKQSVQMPQTLDDFYNINDYIKRISALYITPITTEQPFVSGVLRGGNQTWALIMQGRIPQDFPLKDGTPLNNYEQWFITDRPRWKEAR